MSNTFSSPKLHLALYQPDIPQNVGAAIRLCACLGLSLDIIEPCGFLWNQRKIRQSAMDYIDFIAPIKHDSWSAFLDKYQGMRRIVLMTTKTDATYTDFSYAHGDILLAGRESSGIPEEVYDTLAHKVTIPLTQGFRSLNIVTASAMIAGEALRQLR